jgi:hypothetical protein
MGASLIMDESMQESSNVDDDNGHDGNYIIHYIKTINLPYLIFFLGDGRFDLVD